MKKRNVMLLVLLLVIGFAAVSTTLVLNGTIGIASNDDDFDVIFVEAKLDGNETSKAVISDNKRTITFSSNKLTELNEISRLDYKVKNNSTQYGADVTISCTSEESDYISITSEFAGIPLPITTPVEMEAQEVKNGYISAELIKAYAGADTSISLTCTIIATPTEKENTTDYTPSRYRESILNGADPVLANGLIPVTIANNGTVTYANTDEEWYKYEEKEWANAVILKDGISHNAGDTIPEDDIESYFVWVPKYRYKLFDLGNYDTVIEGEPTEEPKAKEIEIVFDINDTKDADEMSCSTPMISGESGECDVGEWMTHPAFISMQTTGLWVGKFETGYAGATSKESSQVNVTDSSKVIIKPNVYSWRYSAVSNMFKTAYDYNRNLDSHMMKNTEWGAVAYLTHSKYGINKEININNNSDYITGYSAVEGTHQSSFRGENGTDSRETLAYNTTTGYNASTTGNITGIYDMSGGSQEYMASYVDGYGDGASGFTPSEISTYRKYLDKYSNSSSSNSYNNRILGDATGEMGPFYYYDDRDNIKRYHNSWYSDLSHFVSTSSWLSRGGNNGSGLLSGQFYFASVGGSANVNLSSRIVLAP